MTGLGEHCSRRFLLLSEETAEDAGGSAQKTGAGTALEGEEDVVEIHVSVTVLVLDEAGELGHDSGNEARESRSQAAQVQFAEHVLIEKVAGERGDIAGGGIGFAGEEAFDFLQAAGLGGRLGKGTQDGTGKAAKDLVFYIGRDFHLAGGSVDNLPDDVVDVCHRFCVVFVLKDTNLSSKMQKSKFFYFLLQFNKKLLSLQKKPNLNAL